MLKKTYIYLFQYTGSFILILSPSQHCFKRSSNGGGRYFSYFMQYLKIFLGVCDHALKVKTNLIRKLPFIKIRAA